MGISTHILDTSMGRPAASVAVRLFRFLEDAAGERWEQIASGQTDQDGRCKTLLGDHALEVARYRLQFDVGAYFGNLSMEALYPSIDITFSVADPTQHYHIPLLLSANGYTTYRGS